MTVYCARFKFYNTGQINVQKYKSMTERALAMISMSDYADVIDYWEDSNQESESKTVVDKNQSQL